MILCFCFLFLSIFSSTSALGWHAPTRIFDPNAEKDPHGHRKAFEDAMNNLWNDGNSTDADVPTEFTITLDSNDYTISGKVMRTNLDPFRLIYAYQGFRYGKEPDRTSKFKPPIPEPMPFWEGDTFEANHLGFKCPQNSMIGHSISGRKDCLYLNVYTPYLPKSQEMIAADPEGTGLPVMFFIHGGGFTVGDTSMYLPTKLLAHDVILVTIHYRMGAQGFFTLNNADAPGNTALYDMVEALRWTQKYISEFGGDPDQVTIFGESAGSVSVNYMMISPLAAGLFKGVIAESGSSLDNWAIDEDPSYAKNSWATELGCDMTSDATIFECMLDASEEELVMAENHLIMDDRHMGFTGFRGAAPTIQLTEEVTGYAPIFTRHPKDHLYDGEFNKVPFMTGANRQEGSFVVGIMYGDYLQYNDLTDNSTWQNEQMVQQILLSAGIKDHTHAIEDTLTQHFCENIDMKNLTESVPCIIDMVGAIFLKAGSWHTCNIHSYIAPELKRFYYSFEQESDDTMYLWLLGSVDWDTGITHSDEMMYIFSMPATMEGVQIITEKRMTLMWTNFAKYGDPTPDEDKSWADLGLPKWESFEFDDPHYMIISDNWTVEAEFADRWTISYDTLYPPEAPFVTLEPTEEPLVYTESEYQDIKDERDAYLATMIVFIVLFVIEACACIYLFMKSR